MARQLSKPRVFVLTSRIYETAGGRTKATIERMMLLQKHFETMLIEMSSTKYPGEELPAIFAKYHTEFAVTNPWMGSNRSSTTSTKNYLDYLKSRTGNLGEPKFFAGAQENFALPTLTGGEIKAYVENGTIMRLREYHADGSVEFFALDAQQNIFLRELYKQEVLLARCYLDDAGCVKAGFLVDKNGDKKFMYRQKSGHIVYSDDIDAHNGAFLNDILRAGDVVISDVRHYDAALAKLSPEIRKIHVWHETATKLSGEGAINPAYEKIVDPSFPISGSDKIIVFTDDAREEYTGNFPHLKDNFMVIPYGTDLKPTIEGVGRDKNLVISIGRLESAQKNVAAQIRAFAIFHKKYPEARMNIFGDGSEKDNLLALVGALDLGDAVKFCGFSHNVDEEFQRAGMMVFSSNYETFGLTILESLSNGTPVVSYDVRFGAKTMIDNAQNGMTAKENTPKALAAAMVTLRNAKITPQQVRDSIKDRFSRENFEAKWLAAISNDAEGEIT